MRHSGIIKGIVTPLSVVVVALVLSGCSPASTASVSVEGASAKSGFAGRGELAPLDFVRFCMDYSAECRTDRPGEVIALTPATRETLQRVNDSVNGRIRSGTGSGRWRIDPAVGDCNDYVVTKRHDLIRAGLPASALLMSVVRTPRGEGHLVLIVRTDRGDLVLDNLNPEIVPRERAAFTWLKQQSAQDARYWEAI